MGGVTHFKNRRYVYGWEMSCGKKDKALFETAIERLAELIEKTEDLTLVTDGERRYGKILTECVWGTRRFICYRLCTCSNRPYYRNPRIVSHDFLRYFFYIIITLEAAILAVITAFV